MCVSASRRSPTLTSLLIHSVLRCAPHAQVAVRSDRVGRIGQLAHQLDDPSTSCSIPRYVTPRRVDTRACRLSRWRELGAVDSTRMHSANGQLAALGRGHADELIHGPVARARFDQHAQRDSHFRHGNDAARKDMHAQRGDTYAVDTSSRARGRCAPTMGQVYVQRDIG
ncbi:hypothetical protein EXIGLDRAFT_164613 [Exidia glandulosa HHB12029]|uniref:Uncharacterized protein n=1 Tax=Exidia glandulosa HHB12029 TaxID=1314781 RepID=A0A165FDQ4_EXIGL|nr:hypothetical protein EXIGLDRAFT_164613 [Exidia glandulosa HHB12029]